MAGVADLLEGVVGQRRVAQLGVGEARRRTRHRARCCRPARTCRRASACATPRRRRSGRRGNDAAAMRQVTRSKRASSNGSASASARAVSMLARPLAAASLRRLLQHLLGEVAGDHAGDVRREGRRRVPGAGGDVERLPVTAAAAPARPGGRGSRPWRARWTWHRPPRARRTAAAPGICSWGGLRGQPPGGFVQFHRKRTQRV